VPTRDGEAADNPALVSTLAELNRSRLLVTLEVGPLAEDESGILEPACCRQTWPRRSFSLLHERSEGIRSFSKSWCAQVADEKLLEFRAGAWHLPRDPLPILPTRAAEAIEDRLQRLDPAVLETLRVASVVGRASSPAVLAQITGPTSIRSRSACGEPASTDRSS